jgi:raffinose/stachyose/melibiose transport system substrate-binding protein
MKKLGSIFSVALLIGAFLWAAWTIRSRRTAEAPPGVKVIRIGHWQLEAGVREGFIKLAEEFANHPLVQAKHGKVMVVQDAVPEGVYGPWVSTNMVSGTAPDIVQVGLGLPWQVWLGYQVRYFVPLTDLANQPNPFNEGTPLEGMPFRTTHTDGMRDGYQEELLEYMRVPLSRFTMRVFYNRTLLRRLTGLESPPSDFSAFIELCRKIGQQKNEEGEFYYAIASSRYHVALWEGGAINPSTWGLYRYADFNRDGNVGTDEMWVAFKTGVLTFEHPNLALRFRMFEELMKQFQPGFTGLTRDEAVMLFARQGAVFIATGTWDAGSYVLQAQASGFELGLMDFPAPSRDDPVFGPVAYGPRFDQAGQGFAFGVTRFSKHPEVAKDFLRFLASYNYNRRFNDMIGWLPSIRDVEAPELLRGFEPNNSGPWSNMNFNVGGQSTIRFQQDYSLFQTDPRFTFDDFKDRFTPFYIQSGRKDWDEQQRDWRRGLINDEKFVTALRGEAILRAPDDMNDPRWIRYRSYIGRRMVWPEINHANQRRMVQDGPEREAGPYEYLPGALERVRTQLSRQSTDSNNAGVTAP